MLLLLGYGAPAAGSTRCCMGKLFPAHYKECRLEFADIAQPLAGLLGVHLIKLGWGHAIGFQNIPFSLYQFLEKAFPNLKPIFRKCSTQPYCTNLSKRIHSLISHTKILKMGTIPYIKIAKKLILLLIKSYTKISGKKVHSFLKT